MSETVENGTMRRQREIAERAITVSAASVAALLPFMSKDDARYYLKGIFIRPHPDGGALLMATNGHILGIVWDHTAKFLGLPVVCEIPKRIEKAVEKNTDGLVHFVGDIAYVTEVYWQIREGGASAADPTIITQFHAAIAYAPPIDGTFPDVGRVIPKPETFGAVAKISLNPGLMDPFRIAAAALSVPGAAITIYHQLVQDERAPQTSPQTVRIEGCSDFFGAFMPMYAASADFPPVPDWISPIVPAAPSPSDPAGKAPADA